MDSSIAVIAYPLRRILLVLTALTLVSLPFIAAANQSPFLSTQAARHGDLSAFTKWTALMPRYEAQIAMAAEKCADTPCISNQWEALLVTLEGKPELVQIKAINAFFNAIVYVEDRVNYGKEDYWATPYEFMTRGGDCEDYAIAKYISLKRLGISEASMRLVILQDNNLGGIVHAVLEVSAGGTRYLLDNQAKEITAEDAIYHYQPIYAINGSAWWAYDQAASLSK